MTQSRNTGFRTSQGTVRSGSGLSNLASRLARFFRGREAARVAQTAGLAPADVFEGLEQLEQRQLLALLTVGAGDVDPQTGLGTVVLREQGWYAHRFAAITGQQSQPTAVNEDFNDEQAGWTNGAPPAPPNGTFFQTSNIQIAYSSIAATPVQLVRRPIGQNQTDAALRIRLQQTDQVTFIINGQAQGGGGNPTPRQVVNLQFQVSASPGTGGSLINTDPLTGTRLELLRNGQVVATFRGTALENLAQATVSPIGAPARTFTINFENGFDSFRLRSSADAPNNTTYSEDFTLETINTALPGGQFTTIIRGLERYMTVSLTGPVGASLDILDLYGRTFVPLTFPINQGNEPSPGDPTDVGRVQFNDGIGRIVIAGTNARSSVTITGFARDQQGDTFSLSELSEFEQDGVGYAFSRDPQNPQVIGLPSGQGSVIVGSPYVRNNTNPAAYRQTNGFQLTPDDFNRSDQGVFINDGSSIGSILIDGIVHGSSVITGAIDRFSVGVMMGSLRVDGDLGVFSSASDAGVWFRDDDTGANPNSNPTIASGSRLTVGRTAREISVAGRNSLSISVLADVNSASRARLPLVDFYSREAIVNIAQNADESATVQRNFNAGTSYNGRGNGIQGQAIPYGGGFYRNDDASGAEFVGYNGTRVRVFGTINGSDPINGAPDGTDVYSFPADPSREIVISAISSSDTFGGFTDALGLGAAYFRVVDRDGRVVASIDEGRAGRGPGGNATRGSILRFRPDRADVYYLVINVSPQAGGVGLAYGVSVTGMAPVTLGAVKSDSGTGGANAPFNIALSAGSMGLLSVGMGYRTSGGGLALGGTINTNQPANQLGEWSATTTSVPGSLYGVTTGFDIDGANLVVGENLGTLATGSIARGILNGDIFNFSLRTGGTIGTLDVRGALGADQVPDPTRDSRFGTVSISSGRSATRRGDIGQILVGAYISGANVRIETNVNSQIDQLLVGTNNDGAGSEFPGQILDGIPVITTGTGADVRFMDFRQLSRPGDADARQIITYGQSITLTDDAGASVTISFSGGAQLPLGAPAGTPAPTAGTQAVIRTLPINGSRGVAIASINVTLRGGADFTITGNSAGVVSIGRITVDADTAGAGTPGPIQTPFISGLFFTGQAEIDVLEIRQVAGQLRTVSNTTQGGDLVAVDALQLDTLVISSGDLGRTQVSTSGPALLGPFRDIGGGAGGTGVGGPLGVRPEGLNLNNPGGQGGDDWNGTVSYLPINIDDTGFWDGTPQSLEDVGSPIDGYLNGLVVRTGDITSVTVSGSVGDVLAEGGQIITVTANSDNLTPQGQFHGIVGSIYATVIGTVNVGDGLLGTGATALASAGIFADQAIVSVLGTRGTGALIQGTIMAAGVGGVLTQLGTGATPTQLATPVFGIGEVRISGGRFDGALILAQALDDFWQSVRVRDIDVLAGNVRLVSGTNADLFRSEIGGLEIGSVTLTNGAYDATFINAGENIGTVSASSFRNSTRLGSTLEFVTSRIQATRNLANVTAAAGGDIADLTIDVSGSLTGAVTARNFERVNFQVDNTINAINASADFRGNTVVSGGLTGLTVGGNIRSSAFRIAGPINSISSSGEITQVEVQSTGPDGRIDLIRSQGLLQGNISSSGDIGTIESVASNVVGRIETRNDILRPRNGGIASLRAGNDLLVDLSILGTAGSIFATRNIGTFGASNFPLDIRGNLGNLTTQNGQNYADLLVGQSVTGVITNGRVDMRSGTDRVSTAGILVFGRINAIVSSGDWSGDIISRSGGIGSITINQGSLRPDSTITVNNGSLDSLTINAGDLLGDVLVDRNIGAITLNSQGNWRAQIGVSDFKRDFNRFGTDIRNQLPAGVQRTSGVDGVLIKAGGDINAVTVNGGSIWESTIFSGGTIGAVRAAAFRNDTLTPGLNNGLVATNRIDSVVLTDFVGGLAILAGVTSLGADDRVGGTDENLDSAGAGSIGTVQFTGSRVTNSVVMAGIAPSFDGEYNTTSSRVTAGRSIIDSVTATRVINNSQVFSDGFLGFASPGFVKGDFRAVAATEPPLLAPGGINAQAGEVRITQDTAFLITTLSGERARVTISGPGRAFWSASQNRVRLINTTNQTNITIVPANGSTTLTDFRLLGARNAALGTLNVQPRLNGASSVFLDNLIASANFGIVDTTGTIGAGGNLNGVTIDRFLAGTLRGRQVGSLSVAGELGRSGGSASVRFLSLGSLAVGGNIAGAVSVDRDLPTVTAASINSGGIRAGGSINSVTVGSMLNGRIAARNAIGSVNVAGDATGSAILGGVDLGTDADFGGSGAPADTVGAGSVGTVTVGGNFRRSDVGAGVSRGPSGYLGSDDVAVSAGRSSIGTVTIAGNQVGSSLNSEQYRVISTGTIGSVTVGGVPFTGAGNFLVERRDATAVPVRVTNLAVNEDARIYTARITFNQQIDLGTISGALSVVELRSGGAQTIGLAEGTDYTISYDESTATVLVTFSRALTERNLPQQPGLPGPGVYQLILSASVLRGSTRDSRLDGDGDGAGGDDWSRNVVVGDAGDKITAGNPAAQPQIDFYGAADLNLVLRNTPGVGSVPEVNTPFTVVGVIGDHPDTDPDVFRLGGDVDVYRISLRAGQILRLGELSGVALGASVTLRDAAGNQIQAGSALASVLPANEATQTGSTAEQQFLIRSTGTYFIVVAGNAGTDIADANTINNVDVQANAFGRYSMELTVLDDGDTGFNGDTASGTGAAIAYAPTPDVFAGPDGQFNTADDLNRFTVGDWSFRLIRGSSSPAGADAVVTGTNSKGYVSERRSAPNGTFGSANDRISVRIASSIGLPSATGNPTQVAPDVDVFRLNNGNPIAAGTKLRVTLRLTELGSNIGLSPEVTEANLRGLVGLSGNLLSQAILGVFELPAGTGFDNAKLVFAPSDFLPIGNQPASTTTDGRNSYGYDASGNFFFDIVLPGAQGASTDAPASYALALQGAIRSDYTIEILSQGTGSLATRPQNILLETLGGTIDWLEAGQGVTTRLSAYSTSVVGFSGQIDGQSVDNYVLNSLITNLNSIFTAANANVTIATSPVGFQRDDFSTVFLAGNVEPNAFFGNGQYGASQHVDGLNANRNDQAVVFLSSLAELGFDASRQGVDLYVQALTAAVGRRIGELLGVRLETSATGGATIPIMAANSPTLAGQGTYAFANTTRNLAGTGDNADNTAFYFGSQNSGQLLNRIIQARF